MISKCHFNTTMEEGSLDLDSLVDIIQTYKCKFCAFVTENPLFMKEHLTEKHLTHSSSKDDISAPNIRMLPEPRSLEVPSDSLLTHSASSNVIADGGITAVLNGNIDDGGNTLDGEGNVVNGGNITGDIGNIIDGGGSAVDSGDHVNNAVGEEVSNTTVMTTKELFLCGQCQVGFHTMEECKTHIEQDHQMIVDVNIENPGELTFVEPQTLNPDVIGTTTGVVITEEEAMALWRRGKKPGRKRGSKGAQEKNTFDEELAEQLLDADDYRVPLESARGAGKRKVKPPKALLKEYFVGTVKDGENDASAGDVAENGNVQNDLDDPKEDSNMEKEQWARRIDGAKSEGNVEDTTSVPTASVPEPVATVELVHEPKSALDLVKRNKVKRKLDDAPEFEKVQRKKIKYKCQSMFCKGKFSTKDSYESHQQCHSKRRTLACHLCEEKFKQWPQCAIHLWKVHQIDVDLYRCDTCHFRTNAACKLAVHRAIHSDIRPYACKLCGRRFKQASQLINHEGVHANYDAIKDEAAITAKYCEKCDIHFPHCRDVRQHMQEVHGKFSGFPCSQCDHRAASKAALESHLRVHTGEKPYKCDFCTFVCADHNTLRRHRMRHTGDKPYSCPYCSYSCIQSVSLKSHIRTKHGEVAGVWTCKLCSFRTVNEKRYNSHMADHHGGLLPITKTQHGQMTEILTTGGKRLGRVVILPVTPADSNVSQPSAVSKLNKGACIRCGQCDFNTNEMSQMLLHLSSHSKKDGNGAPSVTNGKSLSAVGSRKNIPVSAFNQDVPSIITISKSDCQSGSKPLGASSSLQLLPSVSENMTNATGASVPRSTVITLPVTPSLLSHPLQTSTSSKTDSSLSEHGKLELSQIKLENLTAASSSDPPAQSPVTRSEALTVLKEIEKPNMIDSKQGLDSLVGNSPQADQETVENQPMEIVQFENVINPPSLVDIFSEDKTTVEENVYEIINRHSEALQNSSVSFKFIDVNSDNEGNNMQILEQFYSDGEIKYMVREPTQLFVNQEHQHFQEITEVGDEHKVSVQNEDIIEISDLNSIFVENLQEVSGENSEMVPIITQIGPNQLVVPASQSYEEFRSEIHTETDEIILS